MSPEDFYKARNDRSMRYAGRVLDPQITISLTADPEYISHPEGQASAMVAANLLARMTPSVVLSFEDVEIDRCFRGRFGSSLLDCIRTVMSEADPNGDFQIRDLQSSDYQIHLGPNGAKWIAHGSDWNAYVGPPPSPLRAPSSPNVFGAAFAAILAIAKVFVHPFPRDLERNLADLFSWEPQVGNAVTNLESEFDLGDIWFVGAGSVGSATAHFLALAGLKFDATIFDQDTVKVENLDRSPVFRASDEGRQKADVLAAHLEQFGLHAHAEGVWLDQANIWKARQNGTPDIVVSAANEREVRYIIETQYPPVQVYGTTGQNWQASVFRHVPPQDPCTCCMFPPSSSATPRCATAKLGRPTLGGVDQVDAALPFLSFAAGLMAAAEIAKLPFQVHPIRNRAFFTPCSEDAIFARNMAFRNDCLCRNRNQKIHSQMIAGSKYAGLSRF